MHEIANAFVVLYEHIITIIKGIITDRSSFCQWQTLIANSLFRSHIYVESGHEETYKIEAYGREMICDKFMRFNTINRLFNGNELRLNSRQFCNQLLS